MKRRDALARLKLHADEIRALAATSLFLYGSTARDSARVGSDLDLFLDYDPACRFNASDLVGIKQFPEGHLALA